MNKDEICDKLIELCVKSEQRIEQTNTMIASLV